MLMGTHSVTQRTQAVPQEQARDVKVPQERRTLVRQKRFIGPPGTPPSYHGALPWGCQSSLRNWSSPRFPRDCLWGACGSPMGASSTQGCLPMIPVYSSHECGRRLEGFCVDSAVTVLPAVPTGSPVCAPGGVLQNKDLKCPPPARGSPGPGFCFCSTVTKPACPAHPQS